ncbi:MAG: YegS/Rv2252/BmrU family lipid kinase [Ruminococcus sp.]|nr:YegS/Rv2252/BmrU family lipid kinase [Ruminococcus sp.]
MKKMLFIYNPNAGMGLLKPQLSDVLDTFVKGGYEVTVYPTQQRQDAMEKTRAYTEKYDLVVCSGGDGTLDEVVTGMSMREERVSIGYIPAGTTNDFASSLHIPRDMLEAAEVAVNGKPFPCDVGAFNDNYFVYIAAFGLFTDVSYETDQRMKNILGHLAYVLEGTKKIFNVPSYRIRVSHDGERVEDEFMFGMVTNSRSVGGFKGIIGQNVAFDDGLFEVTLIKTPRTPMDVNEIVTALLGKQIDSTHMYCFRTGSIRFESGEEIPWTLDGEFGGNHGEVLIENRKKELQIMVEEDVIPHLHRKKEEVREEEKKLTVEAAAAELAEEVVAELDGTLEIELEIELDELKEELKEEVKEKMETGLEGGLDKELKIKSGSKEEMKAGLKEEFKEDAKEGIEERLGAGL